MNFVLSWNPVERRFMLVEVGAKPKANKTGQPLEWGDQFPHDGKPFWAESWLDARETFPLDYNKIGL